MKKVFRESIHQIGRSHDCAIYEYKERKIKVVYQAYNANETCETFLFDGNKWNQIFCLEDLGILPNRSAYNIYEPSKRMAQAENFIKKMLIAVKTIL